MAITPDDSDFEQQERLLQINGIYPEAVQEFEERMPEMVEGDFLIGGKFREDFKPFVYSGLVSEFPVNGESVFVVTERGEEVSQGYVDKEEMVESDPSIEKSEAYRVLEAQSEDISQAIIAEELLTQYRRNREHELKDARKEPWKKYLDFGTEMLNNWEETYHRASESDLEELEEYAELLDEQVSQLTENLLRLAERQENQYIEPVRNSMYEMENLADKV